MTTITIHGASDDLVEIDGDVEGADEYGVGLSGHWEGVIDAPGGDTARLYVDYRSTGTWTVALGQYEEDYSLPDWPTTTTVDTNRCPYSVLMTIELPEGSRIVGDRLS